MQTFRPPAAGDVTGRDHAPSGDAPAQHKIPTLAQFTGTEQERVRREFGITPREAADLYDADMLRGQWWSHVLAEFESGHDFTPQAAARLIQAQVRDLSRTTRGLREPLPAHYRKSMVERSPR